MSFDIGNRALCHADSLPTHLTPSKSTACSNCRKDLCVIVCLRSTESTAKLIVLEQAHPWPLVTLLSFHIGRTACGPCPPRCATIEASTALTDEQILMSASMKRASLLAAVPAGYPGLPAPVSPIVLLPTFLCFLCSECWLQADGDSC